MTAFVIVGGLALLALTVAAIGWPLLRPEDDPTVVELDMEEEGVVDTDPLEELAQRRDAIYQAIRELRFDYEVGKVSEADFQTFEAQFKNQAVAVLKEIDALEAAQGDPELDSRLEAEIAALRHTNGRGPAPDAGRAASSAAFCTQCGAALNVGDRFCGKCGKPLA